MIYLQVNENKTQLNIISKGVSDIDFQFFSFTALNAQLKRKQFFSILELNDEAIQFKSLEQFCQQFSAEVTITFEYAFSSLISS